MALRLEWLEAFLTIESGSSAFSLSQVKSTIQQKIRRLIYRIKPSIIIFRNDHRHIPAAIKKEALC